MAAVAAVVAVVAVAVAAAVLLPHLVLVACIFFSTSKKPIDSVRLVEGK